MHSTRTVLYFYNSLNYLATINAECNCTFLILQLYRFNTCSLQNAFFISIIIYIYIYREREKCIYIYIYIYTQITKRVRQQTHRLYHNNTNTTYTYMARASRTCIPSQWSYCSQHSNLCAMNYIKLSIVIVSIVYK